MAAFFRQHGLVPKAPRLSSSSPSPSSLFRNLLLTHMPIISRCLSSGGPLVMRPAPITKDNKDSSTVGKIYDEFYDPLTGITESIERNYFPLVPKSARVFTSSRGWVGFVEANRDISLYLANPLSDSAAVVKLPNIETLNFVRGVKRRPSSAAANSDLAVHRYQTPRICAFGSDEFSVEQFASPVFLKRVVLSKGCETAMLTFEQAIAFCKTGIDNEWTHQFSPYDDGICTYRYPYSPVYSTRDKHFYNLFQSLPGGEENGKEGVECWNVDGMSSDECIITKEYEHDWAREGVETYMVVDEHSGSLFLVYKRNYAKVGRKERRNYDGIEFEIRRLDEDRKGSSQITSIGDLVFFVGSSSECFALSANDFPKLRPNSIYFIDNNCQEFGIYNLQDGKITPLFSSFADKVHHDKRRPLFWVAPLHY